MSPGCDRKTRSGVTLVIGLTKVILSCIKITQRAHFVFKLTEIRNQDFKQKHIILKKKLPSQPPTPKQRIKKQNKNKKTHTAQKIKIKKKVSTKTQQKMSTMLTSQINMKRLPSNQQIKRNNFKAENIIL